MRHKYNVNCVKTEIRAMDQLDCLTLLCVGYLHLHIFNTFLFHWIKIHLLPWVQKHGERQTEEQMAEYDHPLPHCWFEHLQKIERNGEKRFIY